MSTLYPVPARGSVEHGKQVAQEAAQTVKDSGQEHAQQVKDSAQQNAQDVGSSGSDRPQYQTPLTAAARGPGGDRPVRRPRRACGARVDG